MKLRAIRRLIGSDYRVRAGEVFDVPDMEALDLIRRGLASAMEAPQVIYETKVVTPEAPSVSGVPFRHCDYADYQRQGPFYRTSYPVMPVPGTSAVGVGDPGRRSTGRRGRHSG